MWDSGVRKREIEETQNTGRAGALRERVTGSREECGMSIGWPWALEKEQPADSRSPNGQNCLSQ